MAAGPRNDIPHLYASSLLLFLPGYGTTVTCASSSPPGEQGYGRESGPTAWEGLGNVSGHV